MHKRFKHNAIAGALRNRVSVAVRRRSGSTLAITGLSVNDLIEHIESQFTDGMTWENYGRGKWNISYIKPCAEHDLTLEHERMSCFHFSNIKPRWVVSPSTKPSYTT